VNFKEKNKLIRQERKLLNRIKSWIIYKIPVNIIYKVFNLNKKFIVLQWTSYKKILWMISVTSFFLFWRKIWYIDDFIVNKKSRWKWVWKKIFDSTLEKLEKDKNNYTFLVSRYDRKVSHSIYKKYGFKIIGLWIWILAYKKFRKK
jgi:hypothetical protein